MHEEAERNYSSNWGWNNPPEDLTSWTDKEVVTTLWNNTRYRHMTKEHDFSRVSPELNRAWARFREAEANPELFTEIRQGFEENGWYGSPVSE